MRSMAQNDVARPATSRAPGDHGTGEQAIEWALKKAYLELYEFLSAWQQGDAENEWPEFYAWLDGQRTRGGV